MPTRLSILDSFARKMITSGYSQAKIRRTSIDELKFYEVKRCKTENKPLYRTDKNSQTGRNRKKLTSIVRSFD